MTAATLATIPWPDVKDTRYEYPLGYQAPRFTRHLTHGWLRPGPTGVLKSWGSPEGLIRWAANLERAAVLDAVAEEWAAAGKCGFQVVDFVTEVENRIGPAKQHQKQLEKAGDIGTAAHKRVEWEVRHLMGLDLAKPKPELTEESTVAFLAWWQHFERSGITPLRVEQPVWSDLYGWAGTADFLGLRDGKLGIIDTKTSKGIYDSHHLQVATYVGGVNEMLAPYGVQVEWAELWRLPKSREGTFEAVPLGKLWDRTVSPEDLYACFRRHFLNWQLLLGPAGPIA